MLKDTIVVTFSGTPIHKEYQEEFDSLYGNKFHKHIKWTSSYLEQTLYYHAHQDIFKYKKYFGYFLWKPFIILDARFRYPNRVILYCDSNIRFKDIYGFAEKFDYWINKEHLFLVKHDHYFNDEWTKRDTFVNMDADSSLYWSGKQRWSVLFGIRSSEFGGKFLREYQQYCENPSNITEESNICGLDNLPLFRGHKWEQSILSILAERYGIDGPTDIEMLNYYDKIYSTELIKYKEEVNADIS